MSLSRACGLCMRGLMCRWYGNSPAARRFAHLVACRFGRLQRARRQVLPGHRSPSMMRAWSWDLSGAVFNTGHHAYGPQACIACMVLCLTEAVSGLVRLAAKRFRHSFCAGYHCPSAAAEKDMWTGYILIMTSASHAAAQAAYLSTSEHDIARPEPTTAMGIGARSEPWHTRAP